MTKSYAAIRLSVPQYFFMPVMSATERGREVVYFRLATIFQTLGAIEPRRRRYNLPRCQLTLELAAPLLPSKRVERTTPGRVARSQLPETVAETVRYRE